MSSSTVDRRLGLTGGTAFKAPCQLATTANITLSGEQSIDGTTTAASRVLVKNQTDQTTNGIYTTNTAAWTRDLDADGNNDWKNGTLMFVTSGSANAAGLFQQATADPITVGTSNLTFTKIATLAASSVTQANVQNGQLLTVGTITGTNTITGTTVGTAPASLGSGQVIYFVPANTNTGAATFNRDSLGAVSIFFNGAALIGGEIVAAVPALLFHDGTQYQLIGNALANTNYQTEGTVASSGTTVLDTAKPYSQITGVTTITAITLGNGRIRFVEFGGILTLTNGASLILPGGANIKTAAGDTAIFIGEAASVVRCVSFNPASGNPITGTSGLVSLSSVAGTNTITATGPATLAAYTTNQVFVFIPAATNTGATTLNISSIGAKNVFAGGAACIGNELVIGVPTLLEYDGTQFNILGLTGSRGTFTASLGGCTTVPTVTASYSITNNIVSLLVPSTTGTSNTTSCSITGLPAAITPASTRSLNCWTEDNGVGSTFSRVDVTTSSTLALYNGLTSGTFTGSGGKGINIAMQITYNLTP